MTSGRKIVPPEWPCMWTSQSIHVSDFGIHTTSANPKHDNVIRISGNDGMETAISSISVAFTCSKAIKDLISFKTICRSLTCTLFTLQKQDKPGRMIQSEMFKSFTLNNMKCPLHLKGHFAWRRNSSRNWLDLWNSIWECQRLKSRCKMNHAHSAGLLAYELIHWQAWMAQ